MQIVTDNKESDSSVKVDWEKVYHPEHPPIVKWLNVLSEAAYVSKSGKDLTDPRLNLYEKKLRELERYMDEHERKQLLPMQNNFDPGWYYFEDIDLRNGKFVPVGDAKTVLDPSASDAQISEIEVSHEPGMEDMQKNYLVFVSK